MASNAGAMLSPQFSVASSSSSPSYASSSGRRAGGGGGSSSVEEHQAQQRSSSSSHAAAAANASSSMRSASSSSLAASSAPKKASPSDVIFGSSAAARTVEELGLQADASVSAGSSQQTSPEHNGSAAAHSAPATVLADAAGAAPAAREALKEPGVREVEIAEKRELPANFEDADVDDIVLLVADMLTRLTSHNDHLPLHPSALTRFHSRATPGITITSYLRRIARYTSLDKACALILLVYIDRVCERMEGFTVCSLTVHRFTCAAVVCASKALCDAFSTNGHYARVGGISLVELNMLEKEFLSIIDWRLTCSGVLLQHYYASLVRSHASYVLAEPKPTENVAPAQSSNDVSMAEAPYDESSGAGDMAVDEAPAAGVQRFPEEERHGKRRHHASPPAYSDASAGASPDAHARKRNGDVHGAASGVG